MSSNPISRILHFWCHVDFLDLGMVLRSRIRPAFWLGSRPLSTRLRALLDPHACASWLWVAENAGCFCCSVGAWFLVRHRFSFFSQKQQHAPSDGAACTSTVFLPDPAYFYSAGYFILGLCKACFGSGHPYCFISGCTRLSCECFN